MSEKEKQKLDIAYWHLYLRQVARECKDYLYDRNREKERTCLSCQWCEFENPLSVKTYLCGLKRIFKDENLI